MINAPYRLTFPIRLATTGAFVSGATALDSEISLNGGTFADCTNEATEIGTSGIYILDLTAAEMSGNEIAIIVKTSTTNAIQHFHLIQPEPSIESGVVVASTNNSVTLRSGGPSIDDLVVGATIEMVRYTGAGEVRQIIDYNGTTKVATVDRVWKTNPDTTSVYLIHPTLTGKMGTDGVLEANVVQVSGDATAADNLEAMYEGWPIKGSVVDGSPAVGDFNGSSGLSTTNDFYNNLILTFTSGTNAGVSRIVTDYTGASRNLVFSTPFVTAPSNGDAFAITGVAKV